FERAVADGANPGSAWSRAAVQADRLAKDTAPMRPRIGRARPLADRSVGTPDPGAVSSALVVDVIAEALVD
ncbi:MAG: DAK2 domain-containing protein, partial [Actinomycetaceae bacterium]